MIIDADTQSYLEGRSFSNGQRFRIGRSRGSARNDLVTRMASGKRVLHVGCADHIELIEQKRKTGTYLHDALAEAADVLIGIDVNRAALSEMRRVGISDLYHPDDLPPDLEFDLLVATDVIEHVGNVDAFLRSLASHGCDVLVTTPNAFRMINRFQLRSELINSDHRYWFSPYTLAKCLVETGFVVREMSYTDDFPRRQPIRSAIKLFFPFTRDGLAALAKPTQP